MLKFCSDLVAADVHGILGWIWRLLPDLKSYGPMLQPLLHRTMRISCHWVSISHQLRGSRCLFKLYRENNRKSSFVMARKHGWHKPVGWWSTFFFFFFLSTRSFEVGYCHVDWGTLFPPKCSAAHLFMTKVCIMLQTTVDPLISSGCTNCISIYWDFLSCLRLPPPSEITFLCVDCKEPLQFMSGLSPSWFSLWLFFITQWGLKLWEDIAVMLIGILAQSFTDVK